MPFNRKYYLSLFALGLLTIQPSLIAIAASAPPQLTQPIGIADYLTPLPLPQLQLDERGPNNAITDVPGVKVGHVTINQNHPHHFRTGITAIVPDMSQITQGRGNLATWGLPAAVAVLNGNGELTGRGPIETAGILNSPILLTNTRSVGIGIEGVYQFFETHYAKDKWPGDLPVVGECWDGVYNTIAIPAIQPKDVTDALERARAGLVPQGRVGAGTGMRSFELHAGIGSASRKLNIDGKTYTLGILVNTNHSRLQNLNPQLAQLLAQRWGKPLSEIKELDERDAHWPAELGSQPQSQPKRQGSIITIIATDLPLAPHQLRMLAERSALGIGATGSFISTSSGDFTLAFSTANPFPVGSGSPSIQASTPSFNSDAMNPIFKATVHAVLEAQINALLASHAQKE